MKVGHKLKSDSPGGSTRLAGVESDVCDCLVGRVIMAGFVVGMRMFRQLILLVVCIVCQ